MECKETRELLPAYIDAELAAGDALAIDAHLQGCPECRARQAAYASLRNTLAAQGSYFRAPARLTRQIRAALPRVEPASPRVQSTSPTTKPTWRWLNLGGALAVVVALAWSVGLYLLLPSAADRLTDEVVGSHVRSLLSDHLVDVASSDQHTVKPWFNGKLDFAPLVRDLTAEGFPLVGGRVDYLDHRLAAALVYRSRAHPINVFVLPAPGSAPRDAPATMRSHQGYNILNWTRDGMAFWAVSDADATGLVKLAELLKAPAPPSAAGASSNR